MKKLIIFLITIFLIIVIIWASIYFKLPYIEKIPYINKLNVEKNIELSNKEPIIIKDELKIIKEEEVKKEEENPVSTNTTNETTSTELTEDEKERLLKIENLRKRFYLKWTIEKWDNFFESNQPLLAMWEYLKALKQKPDDEKIMKKLATVYFDIKKFDETIITYEKVLNTLDNKEKEKYILSIIYNIDLKSDNDLTDKKNKINALDILNNEEKFYYINSINCVINFHECKKRYQTYFDQNKDLKFDKLLNVKKAIENYTNFKTEFIYYKDALIIWALFENKLYNITNILWQNLLLTKPDYKPIVLLIWKWYYEIWSLVNAKFYLEKYYKLDETNLEITYLLWNINFKLKDYSSSNLYYNSALKWWYEQDVDLKRKLIYNYYLLWDSRSMINMFDYLVREKNSTMDDFSLAIYHGIIEWRITSSTTWAEMWLEKFKDQKWFEIFYGYLWWINRELRKIPEAEEYLKKWLKINSKNPLITLNLWYLEELKMNFSTAEIYFKKTVNMNWDGEFWELAQREIEKIEKLKIQNQSTESEIKSEN